MKAPEPVGVTKVSLSVPEAAWALGVSVPVVRRLILEGHLPKIPFLGKSVRIPTVAVERFAAEAAGEVA